MDMSVLLLASSNFDTAIFPALHTALLTPPHRPLSELNANTLHLPLVPSEWGIDPQLASLIHEPRDLRRVEAARLLVAVRLGRREAPRVGRMGRKRVARVTHP